MKDKKGILFLSVPIIIYGILAIIILGLLIWFGTKISGGISQAIDFFKQYGVWILGGAVLIFYHKIIIAILRAGLGKLGMKV